MNGSGGKGTELGISIGLAFVGGYADASSYLLARTFTGHLTGNCILAAVSVAGRDWYAALDRLLAVILFLAGILLSLTINRFVPARLRQSPLTFAMLLEVLLFLGAGLLLVIGATPEWFIVCMCLALGIQNGALNKTNGISVHSTYMTGMVTTLTQKTFDRFFLKPGPKEDTSNRSAPLGIQILASMWISFIFGAVIGAVMVSSFRSIGLLGIVLPLVGLIIAENAKRFPFKRPSANRPAQTEK
jgi:uncharacterized membrane protein YoaK (UPF0700 family)